MNCDLMVQKPGNIQIQYSRPRKSSCHSKANTMSSSSLPFHLPISTPPSPSNPTLKNHHSPLCLNPDFSDHIAKPRTPSIRSRLSQLCRDGTPHEARRLFDAIPKPTTVLWNTIIIGLVCNNLPLDAILFYSHMKKTALHTKCDPYTYSSVLKACAVSAQLKIGKAVHSHVLRDHSNPSRIVCNSLLKMYATCLDAPWESEGGGLDLVQKMFDTMRKRNVVAWNTLISWYVKTSRFSAAIEKFKLMMKMGIKPTPVSFVHVFPAVLGMGDILGSNVLYGLLVKLGGSYVNDLHAVSSAIYMFAGFACADVARKIFDCCLERNTEVWNTMIAGYAQNNCPIEALDLFLEVFESEEIVLDDVTFLSALTAASQLQELDFGQQLHACVIKSLPTLPIAIINAIIVMYSRCNSVEISFKVFDKMHDRDLVSWNTMVSAFVQNGFNDEGLMLVYEMQNQGFMIDCVTATALLSAASNLRNREIGKQTNAYLLRHGIQFEGMYSYLIDMYAKSGLIRSAQRLFEKLHDHYRDHATWNAMIAGYTQNDLIAEAFFVLRQMLEKKMIPNAVSVASILPACNSMGSINLGKQLHGFSVRYSLDENVFVHSALVDMYSKLGAISCAEKVFAEAVEKNTVTYTTMILAYGQHGLGEKALSLFHSMQESGIPRDSVTYVAVLSSCSYAGLVDEGLQIFDSMKRENRIIPSAEHYCCVVDMLGRVGRLMEAYEFIKELGDEGDTIGIWGSLLAACRVHGEFKLGDVIAEKLLEMEKEKEMTGYHVLLSNMYASEGLWANVDRVRKGMREKGLTKEAGCSWIEIGGQVNYFMSKEQKHPQCDNVYEMLGKLDFEMKDTRQVEE